MAEHHEHTDRLQRAVEGDLDVLEALLAEYAPALRAHLASKIDSWWQSLIDEDDVLQVTFLEAFLRIGSFRDRGAGSFRAWLTTLATNNLRDAIRGLSAQKRTPPAQRLVADPSASAALLLEQIAVTTTTASREFAVGELQTLVQSEVDRLPPDYARVIRLYHLEGRAIDDVARELGRSQGSVYMLRARALDLLRDRLMVALGDSAA